MKTFEVTLIDYINEPIKTFTCLGQCQSEVYFTILNEYHGNMLIKHILVSEVESISIP